MTKQAASLSGVANFWLRAWPKICLPAQGTCLVDANVVLFLLNKVRKWSKCFFWKVPRVTV